ncbi:MAG: ATP-binding cassette domain-containing protein [Micropruina sp.]
MTTDLTAQAASLPAHGSEAVLSLRGAGLRFGDRVLWDGLDLDVHVGEFIAVLGANGSGKSSLLKAVLGQLPLSAGSAEFLGQPIRRGNRRIGYVPQQKLADDGVPLRAQDLVGLGLDGHRWGIPLPSRRRRAAVDALLRDVHAEGYRRAPLATLSGGEQQRLRIGQALAGQPRLLLCDEPLLSLDLAYQATVSELVDASRRSHRLGVLFVTHDINPVLGFVDRVLYIAGGRVRLGTPEQVMRTDVLSDLYGAPVDVLRTHGRIVIVGAPDSHPTHGHREVPDAGDPATTRKAGRP